AAELEAFRAGTTPPAKGYFRGRPARNSSSSSGADGGRRGLSLEAALLALRVRCRLLRVLLRLLGRTGLVAVRNAALVGGAHDRTRCGNTKIGHERRQLAGPQLHVLITSIAVSASRISKRRKPRKGYGWGRNPSTSWIKARSTSSRAFRGRSAWAITKAAS